MSVGHNELQKAYSLLQNAREITEQKMYFGKGSGEDLAKLATALRNEAYDLLQGKATVQEGVTVGAKQILIDLGDLSEAEVYALVDEAKKKFKDALEKDKKKDVASAQQATPPTASIPKVTPTEAVAAPVTGATTAQGAQTLEDIVPSVKGADIPGIPEVDDTPPNVTKGMRSPKVVLPEDTTRRRPTVKG
jgi:hypothetical protein